jgi:hypothetical protein
MLPALMPNARELLEPVRPWLFDEESAADLGLLHAMGVLGSMREAELSLFFRGCVEEELEAQGHGSEFSIFYPACNGLGRVTSDSALQATRRRLRKLVEENLLDVATAARTTSDHLHGRYYWLTRKGTRRVLDAGYRVRSRQNIHNMTHIGSVQDQHRVLEQQYIIARRLINPALRVWGEYSIRSGLAKQAFSTRIAAEPRTIKDHLVALSEELFLTPAELGKSDVPNTKRNRLYFQRRPDALLLDEQAERDRYRDAIGLNFEARPPRTFGDVEWTEVEASKKDAATQAKSFNGIFYLGGMLDPTLERGEVTKFTLVTRNHAHSNLRAKLLDAYERWLAQNEVQAMLKKKAKLTRGFDPQRLGEQVWLARLTQDAEHRLTGIHMETMASITLRGWRSQV